jgi:hypothetical protein
MILSPARGRALLAGVLLATAACTHSDFIAPDRRPEAVFSAARPQTGRVRPGEAGFFALAERIPGFGGYAFDADGNLVAFIKRRTTAGDAAARVLLTRLLDRRRPALGRQGGGVVLRTAEFTFAELASWRDRLTDSLLGRGLGVRSTDVDEAMNRVRIGVGGIAARAAVLRAALEAGVPTTALVIEDEGLVEFEGEAVMSTSGPPYADAPHANGLFYGGMEIVRWTGSEYKGCTLGFYATKGGITVGVSNSHCSRDRDSNGGDGSVFTNSTLNLLGSETYDRNHYDWCPTLFSPFRYCRNADAMLFTVSGTFPVQTLGKIARYTVLNPGSTVARTYQFMDANNPIVIGARTEARSGELVNKAGIATGWTQGNVTATCKDVEQWVSPIVAGHILRCQHEANYGRAGGDSGAPVFSFYQGMADLKGIHSGSYLQVTGTKVVFSPLSGIEADFGPLGGFPSGGSAYVPPAPGCDPLTAIVPC